MRSSHPLPSMKGLLAHPELGLSGTVDPLVTLAERLWRVQGADAYHVQLTYELLRRAAAPAEACTPAALLLLALQHAVSQGSTGMPVLGADGAVALRRYLGLLEWGEGPGIGEQVEAIQGAVAAQRLPWLVGAPGSGLPLVQEGGWLTLQRLWLAETRLALAVRERLRSGVPRLDLASAASVLEQVQAGAGHPLSAAQSYAVATALCSGLSVISGGPGSGKTTVIASLIRALLALGVAPEGIALCAPTGKAAYRMDESIAANLARSKAIPPLERALLRRMAKARTVHRLLRYVPALGTFAHDRYEPLDVQAVIVDEMSMVDLVLAADLFEAVPLQARLIVLGDPDQLPAVEAGAVLRALTPERPSFVAPWRSLLPPDALPVREDDGHPLAHCAVRLETSFRMRADSDGGAAILALAQQIISGQSELEHLPQYQRADALRYVGVEVMVNDDAAEIERVLERWLSQRVLALPEAHRRLQRVFALEGGCFSAEDVQEIIAIVTHFEAFRILCATRVGMRGALAVNRRLIQDLQSALGTSESEWGPGVQVMMTRNDYERGLFNGDSGLILQVAIDGAAPHPMVLFRRGAAEVSVHEVLGIRAFLEPAFATSVHKSQGTEVEQVLLMMPEEARSHGINREMLYTAVTRARQGVVVVGALSTMAAAIRRRAERFSGLAARIADGQDLCPDP